MTVDSPPTHDAKQRIREQAHAARRALENKDALSREVLARVFALPEYERARTVLFYIDVRAEVRTRHALPDALATGKAIVAPWCNEHGELELFRSIYAEVLITARDRISAGNYGGRLGKNFRHLRRQQTAGTMP